MKINKPIKLLIGLATLWIVVIYTLFYILMVLASRWSPTLLTGNEGSISTINQCTVIAGFGLIAFYLIHIFKNPKLGYTGRAIYTIGILFFPFLLMPIYFYCYIWLENPPAFALKYFPFGTLDEVITRFKRDNHE
jgi:hypothetical protein